MAKNINYSIFLFDAFEKAKEIINNNEAENLIARYKIQPPLNTILKVFRNDKIEVLGISVAEGVETIIKNLGQNKYLYSILITALVEKLVNPNQDIRYAQTELDGGYSNRSVDTTYITPFLQEKGLTHCAVSGAESGRNFERPHPYKLDFIGKPRGNGNKEAFLGILHAVEEEEINPESILVYLMLLDLNGKKTDGYNYPKPVGLTIQEIFDSVIQHHSEARGNGRARLPVLAIQAVYQSLVPELARYKDKILRNPPNRHTGNDKKGWIGDIQIDNKDLSPFESVEVKSDKSIKVGVISELNRKFQGQFVDRYYILSTEDIYVLPEDKIEVEYAVKKIRAETGCQVIVNGLKRSLWYYLRLINDPIGFINYYTTQIDTDRDVKDEHRKLWAEILSNLSLSKN